MSASWQWAKANPDTAARLIRELQRENNELRNEIARLNNQTNWVCKCGGTDCEGQRENAALRADKERLDWLLTDDGGFWVNWMYEKDEWTPKLKASRDAIDAAKRRGHE